VGDIQTGGAAAQVPQRHVHAGEAGDAHAGMAKEADIRPGALVKRRRHRRIEADQELFERADHVAQEFEAVAVDGEAQALAGDVLVGVDERQNRVGGADLRVAGRIGRGSGRRTISVRSAVIFTLTLPQALSMDDSELWLIKPE
jgi:hypothetical protein